MSLPHITFYWKDRSGISRSLAEPILPGETTIRWVRHRAIRNGYPGHRGGWWNWFVDDMHQFLVGKRRCPAKHCHIHKTGSYKY